MAKKRNMALKPQTSQILRNFQEKLASITEETIF